MPVKYTSSFRAPTEYERQVEEARRRQMLAEALAQQQYTPGEGNTAPIPRAAPLVKALQGYLTARAGRQAEEAKTAAERAGREEARDYLSAFTPEEVTTPIDMISATPSIKQRFQLQPQQMSNAAIAQGMGVPSFDETTGTVTSTPGAAPTAGPLQFTTGALTPAQRQARILEGMTSANPIVQGIAQAEYAKKPEIEEFYAPTETAAGLVQFGKRGGRRETGFQAAPKDDTTGIREYEYAKSQGYQGSFKDFRNELARAGASTTNVTYGAPVAGVNEKGEPVFFQPSKEGGTPSIVPGVKPEAKALSVDEKKDALYADRMSDAAPILDRLPPPSVTAQAKAGTPGVGNVLQSPENRQFNQAALNFVLAVLRRESGANVPESEIASAMKTYIPMAGDDEGTKEQKRRARESAIRGIALGAGPTYKMVPVNPPEGVSPDLWAEMTLEERRKFAR